MMDPRSWIALPALDGARGHVLLSPPELPEPRAREATLAAGARAAALPMLVTAADASLRLRLARALHASTGSSDPLLASSGHGIPSDPPPPGGTVYVELDGLTPGDLLTLECLLDDGTAWVLAGSDPHATLPDRLATRLHVVHVDAPGVRDVDGTTVVEIARSVVDGLAARTGRPAPVLASEVIEHLQQHGWPAGRLDLETSLSRAFLLVDDEIRLDHLPPGPHVPRETTPAETPTDTPAPVSEARLEYLMGILAHELRNPLVTIKTFAGHLPSLLEDAELRTQFADLTDDAIERIERTLENLVEFVRLGPPSPERLDVTQTLDTVLEELTPVLRDRELHLQRVGDVASVCLADRRHLTYGLRNLLTGVVDEADPEQGVVLDTSVNGVVNLRFATGADASRLRELLSSEASASLRDPTFLPLSFSLARAALERTGAHIGVVPEAGDRTAVVLRLPPAPDDIR